MRRFWVRFSECVISLADNCLVSCRLTVTLITLGRIVCVFVCVFVVVFVFVCLGVILIVQWYKELNGYFTKQIDISSTSQCTGTINKYSYPSHCADLRIFTV